jgi:fumarate hydratase class II
MDGENFRLERDSMGEVRIPREAYYGAQTQRAVENFPVSGIEFPAAFIRALAMVKYAAAAANEELGLLEPRIAGVIRQAAKEVMDGKLGGEFVVDIFQAGSGTSTNMNANEVIANRALEILARPRGSKEIHANDHVNMCQSSNDVIPTAMHCAARLAIERELLPALARLHAALRQKAEEFDEVIKIGRTHLADATPMRLGQEFSGYARQIDLSSERIEAAATGLSGALKALAVSLIKIANDLRWLASGPRCGTGEIQLPDTQPGSSIMPGAFTDKCAGGIAADRARCQEMVEKSLAMVIALAPTIGCAKKKLLPAEELDRILDPGASLSRVSPEEK